jgi:hypothetical protein
LPPRSAQVWIASAQTAAVPDASTAMTLRATRAVVSDTLQVQGEAPGLARIQVVVDGDLSQAVTVMPGSDGRWSATLRTDSMLDPAVPHRVVAWSASDGTVSGPAVFRVQRRWKTVAEHADPRDDDRGPRGEYRYPVSERYDHEPDIERVRVQRTGAALKIELTMRSISTRWNPANGFDRVAFTAFFAIPGGSAGMAAMPQQHGDLPEAMRWNYRLRAHGWSNALFSAAGAGVDNEGTPVVPSADIAVDRPARRVTFTLPARSLGNPASLSGARIYINTWDFDGGYKKLEVGADARGFRYDGARPAPLVLDDTPVIVVP